MTETLRPLGGRLLTREFYFLSFLVLIAAYFILRRFLFGLGDVTHLSHGFPWGIWITYDVVTGTALACGGYAMAVLVYIFNRGQFHVLIRAALLTSVFGYTLAGISIFIDVGRYWQLYNVFLFEYANVNSIMFEVALCVTLYVIVLWIEFSPAILEAMRANRLLRWVRHGLFFFIGLGILLPTMHQSSLGSLLIIAGHKVHPLWQSDFLPLMFLITAIAMGYGMVVFESLFAEVNLGRPLETDLLAKLAGVIPWLLMVYLAIRLIDITASGEWGLFLEWGRAPVLFAIEIGLLLYASVSLLNKQRRRRPTMLYWSAVAVILAGALYRFDAFLIAYDPGVGWHYFPSVGEMAITVGIVSLEIMAYLFFVKKTPVLVAHK